MVNFESKDRIAVLKKIIDEQKADDAKLKKAEEELKKKRMEIKKKKEKVDKSKKKIDEILEEALEAETKDLEENEKNQRNKNMLRKEIISEEEEEENNKIIQESSNILELYTKTPLPKMVEIYQRLDDVYQSIPKINSQEDAKQSQREVYHELKAIADHWGTQKVEEENNKPKFVNYGQEVKENSDDESSSWQRLSDKVKKMTEQAGNDPFYYKTRTETVLNRIRKEFKKQEYNLRGENELR